MNNYRIDIFRADEHYKIEFPEYWLARKFGDCVCSVSDVDSVYLLERISDGSFDITRKLK